VHFILDAVEQLPITDFRVNERGSGSEQYPPSMLMALIIYSYASGVFGSRRIERATWKDVAVRYICGNQHPDHDTICDFRIRNEKAISEAFLQVLKLAKEMGVLKVGTVSVDGTKIKANASIHKSLRYDRAGQIEAQLELEIAELMDKAKQADNTDAEGKAELAQELQRLETLREKMRQAQKRLEKRAKDKAEKKKPRNTGDKDEPDDPPPPPLPLDLMKMYVHILLPGPWDWVKRAMGRTDESD